jgi:hypothetical protein
LGKQNTRRRRRRTRSSGAARIFFPKKEPFSIGKASKFAYELQFKPFKSNFTVRSKVFTLIFGTEILYISFLFKFCIISEETMGQMLGYPSSPLTVEYENESVLGHQRRRALAGSAERRTEQHFTIRIATRGAQPTNVAKLLGTFFVPSRCECAQNI